MSIHVEISEEAKEKLKKQKAAATVSSFLISIAVIGILATILATLTILIPTKEIETIISYKAPPVDQEIDNKPVIQKQQRQTPTPPAASSAVANVITTSSPTAISIPDTNQMVEVESADFGSSADFGMGFGFEDSENSTTTFFGSTVSGSRIAYVIDYSLSMKAQGREKLMRQELSDSITKLEGGADFSLIFFAGPVWQASDQLVFKQGASHATIEKTIQENGKEVTWKHVSGTSEKELEKLQPDWLTPSKEQLEKCVQQINDMPLALGTEWKKPLMKALELKPQPEVIIFMTDGLAGRSEDIAEEISSAAKDKGIVINAVSLLEPAAEEGMKTLAEKTGGTAIIVRDENTIEDLFTGEVTKR